MKKKLDKLAGAFMVQLFIFGYFWAMGNIITGLPDIRRWSDRARIIYVSISALIGTVAGIAFLTIKDEEK